MNSLELLAMLSVLIFVACEVMAFYAYRCEKNHKVKHLSFMAFQLLALWSLGLVYIYSTNTIESFWSGDKLSAVGWIFFVSIFLHMNLVLTEHTRGVDAWWKIALWYLPAAGLWVWELFFLGPGSTVMKVQEFYAAYDAYYLLYGLIVFSLLAIWGINNDYKRKRIQAGIVAGATLFAVVVAYSMERCFPVTIQGVGRADPMHFVAFVLFSGFWYAVHRYEVFNVPSLIKGEDILKRITDVVVVTDWQGKIVKVNPQFTQLSGYLETAAIGRDLRSFIQGIWKEDGRLPEGDVASRAILLGVGNEEIPLQIRLSYVHDSVGEVVGVVVVGQDVRLIRRLEEEIAVRKAKEAELEYRNFHDQLTGMYNRVYFEQKLQQIEAMGNWACSIIIADLDGLKFVNDTFGHEEGDALLLAVAQILQEVVGESGTIARIGGDEFIVLQTSGNASEIQKVEEKIQLTVAKYNETHTRLPLSISMGSATGSFGEATLADVVKKADDSMYRVKLSQRQSNRSGMVRALMNALGARHVETEDHGERLRELAIRLGEEMGMSSCELAELNLLAQFHDLGKVGIPDRILLKEGPLIGEEWEEMKRHTEIGHRIAQSAPELAHIARLILLHHERWDGKGYPLGVEKQDIPLACRIIAVVDSYDAMTNDRPYRKAMEHQQAMAELEKCAGTQFDPVLVEKFMEIMMG